MDKKEENILFGRLIESLEDGFDVNERALILEELKHTDPTEDSLRGAKMLLETNDWDYTILKKGFATTEDKINSIQVKPANTISIYLKYAAVIIPIGLLIGYFVFYNFTPNSIEEYYVKDAGLPRLMNTSATQWDELMDLYKANEIADAYQKSEELLEKMPKNDTAVYYHGVIAYELKDYLVAKNDFLNIVKQDESVFKHDAAYRLAFTSYQLGAKKEAVIQFKEIKTDSANPFSSYATKVLKHIH